MKVSLGVGNKVHGEHYRSVLHKAGVADRIGIENFCGNIDEALEKGRKLCASK
jgi:hypothetical protein